LTKTHNTEHCWSDNLAYSMPPSINSTPRIATPEVPHADDSGQTEGDGQYPGADSGFNKINQALNTLTQDMGSMTGMGVMGGMQGGPDGLESALQELGQIVEDPGDALAEVGKLEQFVAGAQSAPIDSGYSAPTAGRAPAGNSGPAEPGYSAPVGGGSMPQGTLSAPVVTGGAPSASGPAPSGNGALGPNVPSALKPFVQAIDAAAKQTGVPASLIGAQILQESGGNPNAVTTNPALGLPDTGLMQVDQATFQSLQQQYPDLLGGKSVSDPATNIMAGALLDAQLLKQHNGDIGAALTAYNGSADPNYIGEVSSKMNALQNGTPVPGGFS
jgi:Transglycosylase SLT domain